VCYSPILGPLNAVDRERDMVRPLCQLVGLALMLAVSSPSHAADGFEKVRCDQPILPALVGAKSSTVEPVVRTEARRKAIGLRHLGADEVDPGVSTINWEICGREFVVLSVGSVWRDAVELPAHSREAPAFSASACEIGGRKTEGAFLGVFARAAGSGVTALPVKAAWRIDRQKNKFVPLDTAATCATDGIYTADETR
jgi:hypothetical protein